MERKVWEDGMRFDDLMIEHHHPGSPYCPAGGFGMLPADPEITKKSNIAVQKITGKSFNELTQEMIEAICKKTD
jgi:hypothetical protein